MELVVLEKIGPSILNGLGYIEHLEKKSGSKNSLKSCFYVMTRRIRTKWEMRVKILIFSLGPRTTSCRDARKWRNFYSRGCGYIESFGENRVYFIKVHLKTAYFENNSRICWKKFWETTHLVKNLEMCWIKKWKVQHI